MRYKKLQIDTPEAELEKICDNLLEMGISGYEVIDDKPVSNPYEWEYEELRPDIEDMCGISSVIFYLEENEDESSYVEKIQKIVPNVSIDISLTDEAEWRDKWKDYFHSFTIGDILIKPTWEEPPKKYDGSIIIEIDPGISFGTGAHETTRMCIEALSELDLKGKNVLDAGCGSGILSIAANKLGAGHVTCLDIDPDCIVTSRENIKKNHCDLSSFSFCCTDIRGLDIKSADVVVANILADIIVDMLPGIKPRIKPGGTVILSGIIKGKEEMVLLALKNNGFTHLRTKQDGEWFMIMGKI